MNWELHPDGGDLMVNVVTGLYIGRSYSLVHDGALFTTDLCGPIGLRYHCIAWNEL